MKFNAVAIKNLISKTNSNFIEAYNIFSRLKKDTSYTKYWDDLKKKEFDELMEQLNSYFLQSVKNLKDYTDSLNQKVNELQNGV